MQVRSQSTDAIAAAYERLAAAGGDPFRLSEPDRSIVLADTAFGLIGNGGVEYFFESDFPGHPDYAAFAQAFQNVGAGHVADVLRELVGLFPLQHPHRERNLRLDFLASPTPEFTACAARANQLVWEDPSIESGLQSYAAAT
jgi:hypothetical protein